MELTTTRPRDRVLIECIGLRLRGAFASYGDVTFDEPFRAHLEAALLEQKKEHPHDFDVMVELKETDALPSIVITVGGLELYTLEN